MLFNRKNYLGLTVAFILLILGFLLMSGPTPLSQDSFNIEMFNFRRLTLAPIIILFAYGLVAVAILKKPTETCSEEK